MFSFIKKNIAPLYFGLAAGKFAQGKYYDAISLFEKSNSYDPSYEGNGQYLSCLGRCYYYVGNYNKCLNFLTKAFEYYKISKSDINFNNEVAKNDYLNMLNVLIAVLVHFGNNEYANKVNAEFQKFSGK